MPDETQPTPFVRPKPLQNKKNGWLMKGNRSGGNTRFGAIRRMKIEKAFRQAISVDDFLAIAKEVKIAAMLPASSPEEWRVKLDAAKYIIDRELGKPKHHVDVDVSHEGKVDQRVVVADIRSLFGLSDIAPQAKQVQAVEVKAISGSLSAGPDPVSSDYARITDGFAVPDGGGADGPAAAVPEVVDQRPGDVQDRGEG